MIWNSFLKQVEVDGTVWQCYNNKWFKKHDVIVVWNYCHGYYYLENGITIQEDW